MAFKLEAGSGPACLTCTLGSLEQCLWNWACVVFVDPVCSAPACYIPCLKDLGVTPAKRRKEVVKWLWLENPDRRAISEIGKSVSFINFFARSIRRSAI